MTGQAGVAVEVDEVKCNAVGGQTRAQLERFNRWLVLSERAGRAQVITGTSTLIGCRWLIECDDQAHADWLTQWLEQECGFLPVMLRTRKTRRQEANL